MLKEYYIGDTMCGRIKIGIEDNMEKAMSTWDFVYNKFNIGRAEYTIFVTIS